MDFEILNRETIYAGRAFGVQKVYLRLPNQKEKVYDLVAHNDSVTIVPVDKEKNIWFVKQFRLGVEGQLLELPAGVMEKGETPQYSAEREVREETGMGSENLILLGDYYLAPGYSNEHMFTFLATGLYADQLPPDTDEFITIEKIPVEIVYQMAYKGEFKDSKTLAALLLAQPYLTQ